MLVGFEGKRPLVEFKDDETVESFKQRVSIILGIPAETFRIVFAGCQLRAGTTLGDYKIGQETAMHVLINRPKEALFQQPQQPTSKDPVSESVFSPK